MMSSHFAISSGFYLVFAGYVVALLTFCLRLIFNREVHAIFGLRITIVAFLAHLFFLVWHLTGQAYPYFVSPFETFQLIAMALVLTFLVLSFFYHFLGTGVLFLPLALIFYGMSLTPEGTYQLPMVFLQNDWAFVHLLFIFIATALFLISLATGLLYLLQDFRIKSKKSGGFMDRFPPLEILDKIHYKSLYLAFFCFSLGIIAGAGWSKSVTGFYISTDFKQLTSFGLWIFFGIFLLHRAKRGSVGRFGILLVSMGIVALVGLLWWIQG